MSCSSVLYAANTSPQNIASGGSVSFGSVVRRAGKNANLSGGNVIIDGTGYYEVCVNISLSGSPSASTDVVVALYKDGIAIPGASASISIVTSTDYQVSIPCIIRNTCCCESTINALVSGFDVTASNASIVVKKI